MKSKELITELSNRLGWESQEVAEMFSALGIIVGSKLLDQDSINIQGFGTFETRKKAERISVNPANGKRYLVPPKQVVVFKPGMTIKTKLKNLSNNE